MTLDYKPLPSDYDRSMMAVFFGGLRIRFHLVAVGLGILFASCLGHRLRSGGGGAELASHQDGILPVGTKVLVHSKYKGIIRYAGRTTFGPPGNPLWYGVELESGVGKNDGSVNGVRYFSCKPHHGLFTLPKNVISLHDAEGIEAGKVASASAVMAAAASAVAEKPKDPKPTPPDDSTHGLSQSVNQKVLNPRASNPTKKTDAEPSPSDDNDNPEHVPFRVEKADDYLSALDKKIQAMEGDYERADNLALNQIPTLVKINSISSRSNSVPAFHPFRVYGDPEQLEQQNLSLDAQILNMKQRLSGLKRI